MSGLVQAIPVIAARTGREVIVIGGLAVVCRLINPTEPRATSTPSTDAPALNRHSWNFGLQRG